MDTHFTTALMATGGEFVIFTTSHVGHACVIISLPYSVVMIVLRHVVTVDGVCMTSPVLVSLKTVL